jgi:acyl dehydratase
MDEWLVECNRLLGFETEPVEALYPIEYEPIRRYCHAAWDDNPLFVDPEYARRSRFGEVLCPPLGLRAMTVLPGGPLDSPFPPFTGSLPTLPPLPLSMKQTVNLGVEWEFFRPVVVGDRISESARYSKFELKPIRIDPKALFFTVERIYRNQRGEEVAISRTTSMLHRSPDQVKAEGDA